MWSLKLVAPDDKSCLSSITDELFDQIPEAILFLTALHVLSSLPRIRAHVRVLARGISGRTVLSLIIPEDRRNEVDYSAKLMAEAKTINIETVRIQKDGNVPAGLIRPLSSD